MSQSISSNGSAENEVDQWNDDECDEPSSNLALLTSSLPDESQIRSNGNYPQMASVGITSGNVTKKVDLLLEQTLFFLAGLGSSIGYIATLSSLVYFKVLFGANSFVYLNCAVFLPLLPISLAQAIWDARFDLLYFSNVTFLVRGVIGYGFVISGTIGMIIFAHRGGHDSDSSSSQGGLEWVICWALLQGIGGAVLFGQLNQLASFVGSLHQSPDSESSNYDNIPPVDTTAAAEDPILLDENEILPKKFKATVSAGVQASAFVVLLSSISSGFGTMNGVYFANFLIRILQVEALCFVAFLWLLMARPRIQVSFIRRDSSMRELNRFSSDIEEFQDLLSPWGSDDRNDGGNASRLRLPLVQHPSPSDGISSQETIEPTILSLRALLYHSRMSCLGMALTLVPSFLVGSWFTRVQSDWMELAQILFYVRIGSDLTGRFATILIPPSSTRCVVMAAGFRCIAVVAFFLNAEAKIPLNPWGRDAVSICLVAFIAFFSGYLVTSCYQLAPQELPGTATVRAANAARQSSLLTVAFSMSAIGGLVTSFFFISIGV